MPRIDIKEDFSRVLKGERPNIPLLLPIAIDELITKQSGYSYKEYSNDALIAEKIWNSAIEKYNLDAALIFIDDFFEYETFGIEFTDEPNIPKAAKKHILPDRKWLDNAKIPSFNEKRFPMKMELIRRLKEKWGNSVLICASVAAPFTGVSLLFGIQEQMLLFYDDVSLLRDTIEFTKRLSVECSKKLIDSGADLIWFGDCAASSKFIDIGKFGEFVFEPTRDAISQIKAFGGMVIYHAGENNVQHIESMSMLGAEIVNCAEHADMSLLYDAAKENCCMMGNLDPIRGIMNGTPDSIKELIRNQKAMMKNRKKYIINTGEGIPVVTPENNVIALFSAILDNE